MAAGPALLPEISAESTKNREANTDFVSVELDAARTEALLREAHTAYNTRIDDLLLAALVGATAAWNGNDELLVTLERHGREEIDPQLDVSQTIGWFTSLFPVTLRHWWMGQRPGR
jgi:surfactin family lipopeptide synthetase A